MRYAIVGSREYKDLDFVRKYVSKIPLKDEHGNANVLVSGGAKGVDTVAEDTAKATGLCRLIFKANWGKYGRAAGPIRNRKIAKNSDKLTAFWDGSSPGTKNAIQEAEKEGIPVEVYITTQ